MKTPTIKTIAIFALFSVIFWVIIQNGIEYAMNHWVNVYDPPKVEQKIRESKGREKVHVQAIESLQDHTEKIEKRQQRQKIKEHEAIKSIDTIPANRLQDAFTKRYGK